jgi:hypothetical protein
MIHRLFYQLKNGNQSIVIASTGHSSTQAPQSMHSSVTLAFPSSITIASVGHDPTHASHPVQVPSLTFAGILILLIN